MLKPVLLLVFLPLYLAEVCSPKVLGNLDPSIVYQKALMNKLVYENQHTIIYSTGYQATTAYSLANVPADMRVCLVTEWWLDNKTGGYYRTIKVYDAESKLTDQIKIDIIVNEHENHMMEVWPNGERFDVYIIHMDSGVVGLYACQVHQDIDVDGTPIHRNNLNQYYGLSMKTKETKSKAYIRNSWVSKGVTKMETLGLKLSYNDKLSWCYSDKDSEENN